MIYGRCPVICIFQLVYPVGSPIPLTLTLKGTDDQALDLLATPSAVRVTLSRFRLVGSHAISADIEGGRSNNSFIDVCGSGFFWPSAEGAPEFGTRTLQGELEVKKSLKVGFVFPRFSVRVSHPSFTSKNPKVPRPRSTLGLSEA